MHAFRAKVSREGRRQSWLRHLNESAVTAASFYVGPNGGPLVEGGRSGMSVGLREAAALLITLSQGATMQDRNRRLYDT